MFLVSKIIQSKTPGESVTLRVTYKADNPGYFRKEVTVHCNAEQELLKLTVTGEAEEEKEKPLSSTAFVQP